MENLLHGILFKSAQGPKAAFQSMLENLETQKAGEQWATPQYIPKLVEWLRQGLYTQRHEPRVFKQGDVLFDCDICGNTGFKINPISKLRTKCFHGEESHP